MMERTHNSKLRESFAQNALPIWTAADDADSSSLARTSNRILGTKTSSERGLMRQKLQSSMKRCRHRGMNKRHRQFDHKRAGSAWQTFDELQIKPRPSNSGERVRSLCALVFPTDCGLGKPFLDRSFNSVAPLRKSVSSRIML